MKKIDWELILLTLALQVGTFVVVWCLLEIAFGDLENKSPFALILLVVAVILAVKPWESLRGRSR